ncbi:hypothetical protein B296_00009034 [Ensete ventricosum]|uniref:Uncharacterized protein n=1 Tax=Ensete ventricosum TaxID=4639 RepID=A0A427AA49_ENSVE|nr:hypothetical protein B296_00009034 [Ensete ventricosum]
MGGPLKQMQRLLPMEPAGMVHAASPPVQNDLPVAEESHSDLEDKHCMQEHPQAPGVGPAKKVSWQAIIGAPHSTAEG